MKRALLGWWMTIYIFFLLVLLKRTAVWRNSWIKLPTLMPPSCGESGERRGRTAHQREPRTTARRLGLKCFDGLSCVLERLKKHWTRRITEDFAHRTGGRAEHKYREFSQGIILECFIIWENITSFGFLYRQCETKKQKQIDLNIEKGTRSLNFL